MTTGRINQIIKICFFLFFYLTICYFFISLFLLFFQKQSNLNFLLLSLIFSSSFASLSVVLSKYLDAIMNLFLPASSIFHYFPLIFTCFFLFFSSILIFNSPILFSFFILKSSFRGLLFLNFFFSFPLFLPAAVRPHHLLHATSSATLFSPKPRQPRRRSLPDVVRLSHTLQVAAVDHTISILLNNIQSSISISFSFSFSFFFFLFLTLTLLRKSSLHATRR